MRNILLVSAALLASAAALAPPTPPHTNTPNAHTQHDRRAAIAAAALVAASAALTPLEPARAAVIPGLNAPGLVPAAKKTGAKPSFEAIRDRSQFWSPKGIMDSVPKVNGIITPKTPAN